MTSGRDNPVPRGAPVRSPLTFDDLAADLVWPRLLKTAGLALAPARLGLCLFFIAALAVALDVAGWVDGAEGNVVRDGLARVWAAVLGAVGAGVDGDWDAASQALHRAFVSEPDAILGRSWWAAVLFVPVVLALLALVAGAVGRSAACEFTGGARIKWTDALGFAIGRWKSLLGAALAPLVLVWAIGLGLALAGALLLTLPGMNVLGALLYGGALLLGAIAALIIAAFVPGSVLLAPAVACDGADAIDAVQRSYSYVLARPMRLAWYLLVLVAQGAVAVVIASIIAGLTIRFTEAAAGAWLGPKGTAVVNHAFPIETGLVQVGEATAEPLTGTWGVAGRIVRVWSIIPGALVMAYVLSLVFTGSTLLYLAMRRVCDGQDMDEVWMPGMVEGTMAQSLNERSAGAGAPAGASEMVTDDGPADET